MSDQPKGAVARKSLKSPCQLICVFEPSQQICIGCGRNGDEIANWLKYSDAERDQIIAALPRRLEDMHKTRKKTARNKRRNQRGN